MKEKGQRKSFNERFKSIFKSRRQWRREQLSAAVRRDVTIFMRQAHEQVKAELRQEASDQHRADDDGMFQNLEEK